MSSVGFTANGTLTKKRSPAVASRARTGGVPPIRPSASGSGSTIFRGMQRRGSSGQRSCILEGLLDHRLDRRLWNASSPHGLSIQLDVRLRAHVRQVVLVEE